MTPFKSLSRTALALPAAFLPLAAQTPLLNDGTAFGGSKVFSEGLSPLSSPARNSQTPAGWYFGYVSGDQRAQDNSSILQDTTSAVPATVTNALGQLQDAPWAVRTKGYAIVGLRDKMSFGYSREEFNSLLAHLDVDPRDTGSAVALQGNASFVDARRAIVDRLHIGGSTQATGTEVGYRLRIEKWERGTADIFMAQVPGALGGASFPFQSVDNAAMGLASTDYRTSNWALDLGFTTQLAQGIRLGATVDQLNGKRLWDVAMKPQLRAALQLDLGPATQLTLESDVNGVERMPFPVKQQSANASLHYQMSSAVVFILGAERKRIGESAVTRAGATLQLRTQSVLLSFGFQAGQDKPMMGLAAMVK